MSTVYAGEIGFKLSNGRLPWSTLEGGLQKKGYMIVDWPRGVDRDREKGISDLSAEDTYKLYDALFGDDDQIRFVRCEGMLPSIYGTPASQRLSGYAGNNDAATSLAVALGLISRTDPAREIIRTQAGNRQGSG